MGSRGKIVIGVTGVIGSGKSTLCKFLCEKHGFYWINADAMVHELYKPDQAGYKKIKDYFGNQFVGPRGVHRGRLRRFILKTPQKLWILNQLIHPLVVHEVNKKIGAYSGGNQRDSSLAHPALICIEAVYFEPKDLGRFIDELVIVHAVDEVIMRRLVKRKIPSKQLTTLLKFQRKNLPKFGVRIENNSTLPSFSKKIPTLLRQFH